MRLTTNLSAMLRLAGASILGLGLLGCAATPNQNAQEVPAQRPISEIVKPDVEYPIDVYDPWEGFHRGVYKFNARFDQYVFLPVVKAYETILPDFVEDGVSNFFSNLGDIKNLINNALQLKEERFLKTTARLITNTTIGILGVWDPATRLGMEEQEEDFGQTLGHWGVGDGPYLVLPILGPSNPRDTGGLAADGLMFTAIDPLDFEDHEEREWIFYILGGIDKRHQESFLYFQTGSPFEYDLVRLLYSKKRQLEIAK